MTRFFIYINIFFIWIMFVIIAINVNKLNKFHLLEHSKNDINIVNYIKQVEIDYGDGITETIVYPEIKTIKIIKYKDIFIDQKEQYFLKLKIILESQ